MMSEVDRIVRESKGESEEESEANRMVQAPERGVDQPASGAYQQVFAITEMHEVREKVWNSGILNPIPDFWVCTSGIPGVWGSKSGINAKIPEFF